MAYTETLQYTLTWNITSGVPSPFNDPLSTYDTVLTGPLGPQTVTLQETNFYAQPNTSSLVTTLTITDPSPFFTISSDGSSSSLSATTSASPSSAAFTPAAATSSSSSTPTPTSPPASGLSHGAKIGIGIGVAVGVGGLAAIVGAVVYFLHRRKRSAATKYDKPDVMSDQPVSRPPMFQDD